MTNEFMLMDRIQKIQQIITKYGENNFCISYSGGKDSCVLSALIDMAVPNNTIPRVYANTGIELKMISDFVYNKSLIDDRIIIIAPSVPIKDMLERYGYPFKSKKHSKVVAIYQKHKTTDGRTGLQHYLHINEDGVNWGSKNSCPQKLKYQFTPDFNLKVSDICCLKMKEEPLDNWAKDHNKKYKIIGIMRDEGGRRDKALCLRFKNGKFKAFQPLAPITKEWEEWFIEKYDVKICDIYKPPYNFSRTGCKGCPFALHLQQELDTLEQFFPNERKQCEYIWKPVYDEYRRLGYRLRKDEKIKILEDLQKGQIEGQMNIFDYEGNDEKVLISESN